MHEFTTKRFIMGRGKALFINLLIFFLLLSSFSSLFAAHTDYPVGFSGSYDSSLKYWRISDGTCIRTMTGHAYSVYSVAISPDGQYGLSGSYDHTLRYWHISDGTCIRTFTGHSHEVLSVAISPDGQYALSGSDDKTLKYWRISDGTCIRTFTGHSDDVETVAISPDGQYALSGSDDKTLKYWRISDGTCIRTFTGHSYYVNSVAISPDGQYALSGSTDKTLKYWRISDGTCIRTFTGHSTGVLSVAISPDGQYALSGSSDKTLKYWRISDGTCIRTFNGHSNYVMSVAISPDGQYALSGSLDNTLKYWRISDGTCIRTFTGHSDDVYSVAIGKAYLDVIYPNGGETFYTGDTKTITWSPLGIVDSVKVDYTTNNGSSWTQITKKANTGSHSWTVPNSPSSQCKIKLTGYNGTYELCQDQSDANFTIAKETGFTYYRNAFAIPLVFAATPQPFSNELRLSLPEKAIIYDLSGKRIALYEKGVHSVNTSLYQAGVYIIQCGSKTKRIVKID